MNIASYIDHTLLAADATPTKVDTLCKEALVHNFCSVCVNSSFVERCVSNLQGSSIKVCTVVGFPLGAGSTHAKIEETKYALRKGADEIDMVIHIGQLKSNNVEYVVHDISEVVKAAHGKVVKVIIEATLLSDEEKQLACECAKKANAHFVKTSTGFAPSGATVEDVALMRKVVGDTMGVKASGGIRTWNDAHAMITAGANRLGCSSGVAIVQGQDN